MERTNAIITVCVILLVLVFVGALVLSSHTIQRIRIQTAACQAVGGYLVGENCLPACGVSIDTSLSPRVQE